MPVPGITHLNDVDMSPRRRSIVPQITSTPYIANDDEVERFTRRTNSELQRRVSSIGVANRSGLSSDNEGGVELNESKLQDHYQTCVKLFTENKINAKNAWNVHIVEYMQAMLKKGLVMKDTLKLASTSIDIGCKVYCLKVDQVHSDLFKLASAMARVNMEENERENGDDDAHADSGLEDEQPVASKKKEKKKKRVRRSYDDQDCELTVATNENSLNGVITPHNTTLQQVSAGKSRLYTLSTITRQKWGFEQMVNCRSNFPYFTPLDSNTENIKISDQKVPVTIPSVKSQLCPAFNDFIIDRWQPDDDEVPLGTQPLSNLTLNNIVYDDNGLPIPDLDASVHDSDDRDNVFEDAEEIVETVGNAEIRRPVAFITEMRPGQGPLSDVPLQYSYRSAPVISERYKLTGIWAGPSHWKIKALQRRPAGGDSESVSTAPQRGRRPAKKSEPTIHDLDAESDVEDDVLFASRNKKKKCVRRGSISKVTLPEYLSITNDEICRLKNNPEVRVHVQNSTEAGSADASRVNLNMTANYQYDNPDDADYCSQTLNNNADGDGDDQNDFNNDNNDVLQHTLTDENMLIAPSQVQKFQVPYATQAKRMDMRKLKDAIWKTMAVTETKDDHIVEDEEKLTNVQLHKVSFSEMYEILPSYVTSRMAEELSAPLAFVALLHLANEETLKLEGTPEFKDILISTDK